MTPQITNQNKETKKKCASGRRFGKHLLKAFAVTALLGLTFWLLWNQAGVPLFTFPPLTYWQSLGAVLMTGLLLGTSLLAAGRRHPPHGCRVGRRTDNGPRDI